EGLTISIIYGEPSATVAGPGEEGSGGCIGRQEALTGRSGGGSQASNSAAAPAVQGLDIPADDPPGVPDLDRLAAAIGNACAPFEVGWQNDVILPGSCFLHHGALRRAEVPVG